MSKKWGDTIIIHIGTLLWYQGCNRDLMRGVEREDWKGVWYKYRLGATFYIYKKFNFYCSSIFITIYIRKM